MKRLNYFFAWVDRQMLPVFDGVGHRANAMYGNFKKVGPDCQSGRPNDRRAADHLTSLHPSLKELWMASKGLRRTRGCPALSGDKVDRKLSVLISDFLIRIARAQGA